MANSSNNTHEVLLFEDFSAPYADSVRRLFPRSALVVRTENLGLDDGLGADWCPTIMDVLVDLARRHSLLASWQTTLLSQQEFLESLKVVCARLNQRDYGEFSVPTSDVISAHLDYSHGEVNDRTTAYKDFIKECNVLDQFGLLLLLDENRATIDESLSQSFIIEGPVRTAWHKAAVEFLARGKTLRSVHVETPVDGAVDTEVAADQVHFEDVEMIVPKDVSPPKHSRSLVYTLTILKSFLSLLVNSRDEVAIACALACPLVNLSHDAFTAIKRAASDAKSPIYQFILSYVMKKKLGGAVHAPPANCPVKGHLREMTAFINIMDKLQTFIEEHTPAVALNKVVTCVFARLSKEVQQQQGAFRDSMVDKARDIVRMLTKRIDGKARVDSRIPSGIVGREALQRVRTLADSLASLGYHEKPAKILCSPFSAATPSKTPVGSQILFKLFKSPADLQDDDDEVVPLAERAPLPAAPERKTAMAFSVRYEPEPPKIFTADLDIVEIATTQSDNATAVNNADRMPIDILEAETVLPVKPSLTVRPGNANGSPVIKRPALKRKEPSKNGGAKKKLKLVSADDPENQLPGAKKPKETKKKPVKSNAVVGQRSINSFFTKA